MFNSRKRAADLTDINNFFLPLYFPHCTSIHVNLTLSIETYLYIYIYINNLPYVQ